MRSRRSLHALLVLALAVLAGCGRGGSSSTPSLLPTASAAPKATASSAASEASLLPLPEPPGGPRSRARVTPLANGAALVTGGLGAKGPLAQVLYLDPLLGKFVELPPLHDARYGHEATLLPGRDGKLGTADDEVLVTGGYDGKKLLASVELVQLDPSGDAARARVLTLPPLPLARSEHRAVLVSLGGGSARIPWSGDVGILVIGGVVPVPGGDPEASSSAIVYRPRRGEDGLVTTGQGVYYSQPRVARYEHAATLLPGPDGVVGTDDDRVLVWGGIGFDPRAAAVRSDAPPALGPLASGEVYEPGLDRWSEVRVAPDSEPLAGALATTPRRGHRAARLASGAALLVGGTDGSRERRALRDSLVVELDARDAGLARVSRGATLAHGRRDPEVAEVEQGRLLVAGGVDPDTGLARGDAEVIAASGRSIETSLPMGAGRVQHGLAALGTRVLVFGGLSDPGVFASPTAGLLLDRAR